MKIAILPSNQHLNAGKGGKTEEEWAIVACAELVEELKRQNYGDVRMFWVPGAGKKSTDELAVMIRQALAWNYDFCLSIHSDAATSVDIFPQIRSEADRAWADAVGKPLAQRLNMPYQYAAIRGHNLMFFYDMPRKKNLLLEIGCHTPSATAAKFNVKYARFEGIMAARYFLAGTPGLKLAYDGPVPVGVEVPDGQEKYKPASCAQMPDLVFGWRQLWRLAPCQSDPMVGYAKTDPIGYLEWKLRKRHPDREWGPYRGVYDRTLEGDVRVFQKEVSLPVTGEMHEADWKVLMAPGAP